MFEALKARLKSSEEGNAPCMYLDSLGFVTVGVGHLLATSGIAAALPFVTPSGLLRACAPDIQAEYVEVRGMTPGQVLQYYMRRTTLRLPQATIDGLLDADVEEKQRGMCALIVGFGDFPEAAQDALLDMAFQLGPHGLVSKFPTLIAAAKQDDWATCAANCSVRDTQVLRNETRADLFLQAASQAKSQNA